MASILDFVAVAASTDVGKIIIGAVGAMGIAWLNTRLGIWRDDRTEKRRTKGHLAYSVALLESALRQFVKDCFAVVSDEGKRITDEGYDDWVSAVSSPILKLSEKIEWPLIDHGVMYDILAIETMKSRIEREIQWEYEEATPPDRHGFIEARQERYLDLSAFVVNILRELHRVHPYKFTSDQKEFERNVIAMRRELALSKEELQRARLPMLGKTQQDGVST